MDDNNTETVPIRPSTEELESENLILDDPEEENVRYRQVVREVFDKQFRHEDYKDNSRHPSYTRFELPYDIQCRNRYKAAKQLYEKQFQKEIQMLLDQQPSGYEAARFTRHLCITTLWPPLHSRAEIVNTQRYFFSLNRNQQKRLNWIMATNII